MRCGNEAGARNYCNRHKGYPLYLIFKDERVLGLKDRAELAQALQCDKVRGRGAAGGVGETAGVGTEAVVGRGGQQGQW